MEGNMFVPSVCILISFPNSIFQIAMADALSPNPATQKRRLPMAARLQSPTRPFFLGSNDDNREHAQARTAPAFAIRRKSVALNLLPQQGDPNHGLRKAQILELFQNCIKLSSDYKNTWELNLIDHLTVIINVEEEKDAETNFQKASCTLEGGVKIYSMRVDSVHTEAYKVLGGMNRVGQESEQDTRVEDANVDNGKDVASSRMRCRRRYLPHQRWNHLLEALNVKKLHLQLIPSIIRRLHNLMKVGPRVF
ncbi:condensin complex subunit 2-like [Malus domestica]|uniref:condensin complex subunit 2-like n=1 Tax=Malus domestica TaxID=3750 RepID=UPI0039771ACD